MLRNSLALLFLLFVSWSSFAETEAELLLRQLRPRMADVIKMNEGYQTPANIPIQVNHLNFQAFLTAIVKGAPDFIAKLEKAYPHATFAFLGRDTQLISDIVDAVYISRGEKNRVVQIATSKHTLDGMTSAQIVEYLKHANFDINSLSPEKPFIIIDTISKGDVLTIDRYQRHVTGRQGRHILQAVYDYWTNSLGRNPVDLVKSFNFVGMQVSTYDVANPQNLRVYADISNLSSIQEQNIARLSNRTANTNFGYDMIVPLIADTKYKFNEAGYDHFTSAWHGRYEKPSYTGTGWQVTPGAAYPATYRQSVLWIQNEIVELTEKKGFQKEIDDSAKDYEAVLPPFVYNCKSIFKN